MSSPGVQVIVSLAQPEIKGRAALMDGMKPIGFTVMQVGRAVGRLFNWVAARLGDMDFLNVVVVVIVVDFPLMPEDEPQMP